MSRHGWDTVVAQHGQITHLGQYYHANFIILLGQYYVEVQSIRVHLG